MEPFMSPHKHMRIALQERVPRSNRELRGGGPCLRERVQAEQRVRAWL